MLALLPREIHFNNGMQEHNTVSKAIAYYGAEQERNSLHSFECTLHSQRYDFDLGEQRQSIYYNATNKLIKKVSRPMSPRSPPIPARQGSHCHNDYTYTQGGMFAIVP